MRRKKPKIKNSGQATLFENSFLEFLTKAPASVSATLYIIINVLLIYIGLRLQVVDSVFSGVLLFVGAMFFWTFFEYFFHRYINHVDEYFPNSELARKVAYTLHGNHHEYPRDKQRLVMPPVPGLFIIVMLYLVFRLLLGPLVYIFMPGFMTGYLIYTYIHTSTHKSNVPGYLKHLYRHHALHHYKYPEKAFGVSTTLWDRVFGTMPPEDG
ncbi:sterol desaturase family protein [Aliifodinibius sp. S!AR15-10]|uniref:sterol desaturase family protein n=1 Tax=Aliifodinibius sp. S!AR15-10 TaxID=2950437 RepID=UPI0028553082|nr:sterol desaturase family protein [Aliifodinibius sp. S!AR15-10]MDR8393686.1 sterol desaturase family protein [Aliifodinibius sp. S!AR15-10]